ncbi:hypothetical protein H5398_08460 [Tessaracoccus sp. MC1679]|uniref:hypothetical protein n=1 Tax=Tessaracoccus sp. MC1679 TaxID=2760313 RepID=UPI001602554F|nr:hypothetical protein [Tessaracoccus sp. MC1679]MBB1515997.1 hypothetical protein [Tessaracoccus sp. MC1679]
MAEKLADPEEALRALSAMGTLYWKNSASARVRWIRTFPAIQIMGTVRIAVDHYEHGTFWPKLTEAMQIRPGQLFSQEWGSAFLDNLEALGMPQFDDIDDPGLRFVGPILMHAGMPTYCLGDYFRLVTEQRARDGSLTPEGFVAWASARSAEGRLYNTDKPVERFLRYGGDYAVDVTDRVFELLDVVAAGGSGEGVPLPQRYRQAVIDLRRRGELDRRIPTRGRVADQEQRAQLVLDPYGRGPLLWLPAVAEGQADWTVTVGLNAQRVRSSAVWPGEPAPPTEVPIPSPVRSVSASLRTRPDLAMSVAVVDDKDPLLAFSEDGRFLLPGLPLPGAPVWLLYPGNPDALHVTGHAELMSEGAVPPGWVGWTMRLLDLKHADAIRVEGTERARTVRRVTAARIVTGEPIRGLTCGDAPVFGDVPRVELPDGGDGAAAWSLSITSADGSVAIENRPLQSGAPEEVWAGVHRPLIGKYRVRVRGPWGRGVVRDLNLAEGLTSDSDPKWRRINRAGLVPASVRLKLPEGMEADTASITLAEDEEQQPIELRVGAARLRVTVRPPHMTMSYQSATMSTAPSIRPLQLYSEDVRESEGFLAVDLGESGQPCLHALVRRHCVQELEPTGGTRGGVYRFNLGQLSDTLASHARIEIALDEGAEMIVAQVNPRRLCSDIVLEDGALQLVDGVDVDGLTALVYPQRAPWRGATLLEVKDDQAPLPSGLRDAGPLLVVLRIVDPWAPVPIPAWPDSFGCRLVDAPGFLSTDDAAESQLSRCLSGEGQFPEHTAQLSWVWAIVTRWNALGLPADVAPAVARSCQTVLREDPAASLMALEESEVEVHRLPQVLIRSGLVWEASDLASRARLPWGSASGLPAVLLGSSRLVEQAGSHSEDLTRAEALFGDAVHSLLSGVDPSPRAGRFDAGAEVYQRLDSLERSDFRRQAALVPKGSLDRDTRVRAALDLLDQLGRMNPKVEAQAAHVLTAIEAHLRRRGDQAGLQAIVDRRPPAKQTGWRALPALSIALAWVARRGARGDGECVTLIQKLQGLWIEFARFAPDLVTIDLIIAELLQAASHARQTKEGS